MQKHYKARDKTVSKMSRDGLLKENLCSGESARVSRREKDSLALSERAEDAPGFSDAWNRRGNRKTGNQKRQCAVDLKKPDSCSVDMKGTGAARPDDTAIGSGEQEETEKTCESVWREKGMQMPQQYYFSERQGASGGMDHSFNGRKRRQPTVVEKARGNIAGNGFQQQASQPLDSRIEKAQAAQFFSDGDEKMQTDDADDPVKDVFEQTEDTESRVLARPSRMENIQRRPSRDSSFVSAVAETGLIRKKRQTRSYPQSGKREPAFSKMKKHDEAYSEKENGRDLAAEGLDKEAQGHNVTAAENQDAALLGTSRDDKRDRTMRDRLYKNRHQKLFYYPVENEGNGETAKNRTKKRSCISFHDKAKSGRIAANKKGRPGQKYKCKEQKKWPRLSFDDEGCEMIRGSGMGIAKRAAFSAAYSAADYAYGSGQDQEYGAVDGACKTALAGQDAIRYGLRPSGRRKLKRFSRLRESRVEKCALYVERSRLQHGPKQVTRKKATGECSGGTEQAKKDAAKHWQKQRIRKSYQVVRQGERTAAQKFFTKTKYMAVETLRKNKGIFGAAAVLVLLFAAMSAGMSACGAVLQGAASSIIGTTYPSADADIYAVESDYAALEDALDSQINSMESTHPGFDEYLYQVDEISHNPYQLVSYFSAKYGGFTYEQVADEIGEIFREQYCLYVDETAETVTQTKTVRVGESLGQVVTSGYCSCQLCCGIWSGGPTASGVYPTAGHTLAVDASNPFVPAGTKVVMNGVEYVVEDTGAFASYGVQFDVYYADHAAAAAHGHQMWEAYLADSSGGREVEVTASEKVKRLKVTLTNRGLDAVLRGRMDADEEKRYDLYNLTYGNRNYLFDTESLPTGGGADGGYEVPAEALSDAGFARMIQEAEKYLGFPYVWGGSSPATSFDCSGFVSWVVNNCGNGWSVGRQTAEGLRGCCTYVPPSEAKPGDLIFFQGTYHTQGASHVGIYVGNDTMIHCGNPVQYSNISTQYWKQHFFEFGRMQ